MSIRPLACLCSVVALLLAPPALAADTLTPADLAPAEAAFPCRPQGAITEAYWACLAAAGVPPGGVLFAQRLNADPRIGTPGLPLELTELGPVDLAEVTFPFLANTNDQVLFVNGADFVLQPLAMEPDRPDDPVSAALARAYPQAFPALRVTVTGHRRDGGQQRFVVTDVLTDGCRACAVVGAAVFAVTFDNGVQTGVEALGWVPETLAAQPSRQALIRQGDMHAVQLALTLRGYQPGRIDGQEGAETQAALAEFQADNCLTIESQANHEALALLMEPGPHMTPRSCPRGAGN